MRKKIRLRNLKNKFNVKEKPLYEKIINFILLNIGFTVAAMGYVFFMLKSKIVPGGATGVATVLYYTAQLPVSVTILIINIFLIAIQAKIMGFKSSYKTIYVILMQPVIIQYFVDIQESVHVTDDRMLACLFGGVLTGIGIGIVIKVGGSTGGSDILAQLFSRWFKVSVGKALTAIDFTIAISSGFILGNIELALYGIITIFFTSRIIDIIQQGLNYSKVVYIISPQYQIIAESLMGRLERGATLLDVKGMFSDENRKMIMIVISKRQIFALKETIKQFDENAFVVVTEAFSVMGRGFRQINEDEE